MKFVTDKRCCGCLLYTSDISPFIKFGCLKDEKFGKKVKDSILYKNLEHSYVTLEEYIQAEKEAKGLTDTEEQAETVENTEAEAGDAEKKESEKLTVYYVTDEQQQSQYVKMFKEQGQQAVVLNHKLILHLLLIWNSRMRTLSSRELMRMFWMH